MKLLQLNVFFRLPDDFEGDDVDALELMLKHRKERREAGTNPTVSMDESVGHDSATDIFNAWIGLQDPEYKKTEFKLVGVSGAYKQEDGEWKLLSGSEGFQIDG